jgi:RNA polymerase sigma-54 factor
MKLSQKLSPQQIQLMKLLQIPTATLEQRIKEELEANPALEEGENRDDYENEDRMEDRLESPQDDEKYDDKDEYNEEEDFTQNDYEFEYLNEYIDDDDQSYRYNTESYSASDEDERTMPIAIENSFHEYLLQQISLLNLRSEREELIAKQIIGSIDEDGYLRRESMAISDDLLFSQNIEASIEEIDSILCLVQRLDPPGIGARDLQECLNLQLLHRLDHEKLDSEDIFSIKCAIRIIMEFFDEFSKKHYQKLQRHLNISELQLKNTIDIILKLNPKPASGHSSGSNERALQYIVPDFLVSNRDNELDLVLNSRNAPDLRISDHYKEMIKDYQTSKVSNSTTRTQKEAITFIKNKIDSAKWFIDAIRQRQDTMLSTMYTIMQLQLDYFKTGDEKKLRPMILKDIAEITGLDISTVSRVANSKYVQTEFGTRRLKDFFSESLQTESGEEVSTLEVKKILKDLIVDESKRKPHSDEKLKAMLQKRGYNIARRTVAKYREQLDIPVARLRKAL